MAEAPQDPAGTTHQFRTFAKQGQTEEKSSGVNTGLIIGMVAVVVIVAIAAIALMMV